MFEKLFVKLMVFKHDYREIGTGRMYGQKSSFYKCIKCNDMMYVPLGMQDMLIQRGCSKRKLKEGESNVRNKDS